MRNFPLCLLPLLAAGGVAFTPSLVNKCCDLGEHWNVSVGECQGFSNDYNNNDHWVWSPSFYKLTEDNDCVVKIEGDEARNLSKTVINFSVGLPQKCEASMNWSVIPSRNIPGEYGLGRYRLLTNGSVVINYDNGSWISLSPGTFCVNEILTGGYHHKKGNETERGRKSSLVLLVCKEEYKVKGPKKPIPLKFALMLYSAAVILSMTILVYLIIWNRHNIYEWTVFFEVLSMVCMIVFLAVSHTIARDPTDGYYGSKKCILLGMLSHYFFLATFFWLFVINFEIWWNFRNLMLRKNKSRKWLRLLNYQIFGFGGPGLIVLIGWLLDRKYGLQNDRIDCTSLTLPNYGQLNCYISKRAQGPYIYFPVGILLGCNLLFYFLTVFKMCQYQKNSQQINKSRTNGNFQPVVVFARLFIVMGVSWIFEIVSWAINPGVKGRVPLYWIIFDIVTLVQAIAIFIIFVCRRDILNKLTEKIPALNVILGPLLRTSCCGKSPNCKNISPVSSNGTSPSSLNGDSRAVSERTLQTNLDLSLTDLSRGTQPNA